MKAFLLAAGLGTRLRPLTDTKPKCMLEIQGQPLLDIWLDAFASAGVDDVLVNLHHLPQVVRDHLGRRGTPPVVRTFFEPELLGSAGTLSANKSWVQGEEMFLVCYADNLTDFELAKLVGAHRLNMQRGLEATIAVFRAGEPSACGIVELDSAGVMVGFVEKPPNPRSDLANAGIYAFSPSVIEGLEGSPPMDIGFDLLPRLVGRAGTVTAEGYFRDIGTHAAYAAAQRDWRGVTAR